MALKFNKTKVSDKAWGSVSKSKLGRRLAEAYAAGELTRAQIKDAYAFVPDDAFTESDGEKSFAYSKAWGPHHEIAGDEVVVNRNGVHAAAAAASGARTEPGLTESQLATAKRHIRVHYKALKEDVPENLRESLAPIPARVLEELTQGSFEYESEARRRAFEAQFNPDGARFNLYICETFPDHVIVNDWSSDSELAADEYWKIGYSESSGDYVFADRDAWEKVVLTYQDAGDATTEESREDDARALEEVKGSYEYIAWGVRDAFNKKFNADYEYRYNIVETFPDRVIVNQYGRDSKLKSDEYWQVTYNETGGEYTFAERDAWQLVELTYQAVSGGGTDESRDDPPAPKKLDEEHSDKTDPDPSRKRFEEQVDLVEVELLESDKVSGRIRVKGAMTAGIVNGNRRRYPRSVVSEALVDLKQHLHESAGQGRIKQVLGEAEHPSSKGKRPSLLETVAKWDDVELREDSVDIDGHIIRTRNGLDILALVEGEVKFGISMRGYGDSVIVKENGQSIEEVTSLRITGFDLVLEPSFENRALVESLQDPEPTHLQDEVEEEMDPEKLKAMIEANPDMFKSLLEGMAIEKLEQASADQLKKLEEVARKTLGVKPEQDLGKALEEAASARDQLAEIRRVEARDKAIKEATEKLPYKKAVNEAFTKELTEAVNDDDGTGVKGIAESLRKRYDAFASEFKLVGMGYTGGDGRPVAPVLDVNSSLEEETGTPEYARAAHEITESLIRANVSRRRVFMVKPKNLNEVFAQKYIKLYDEHFKAQLAEETRRFMEAEQTSDHASGNYPFSIARAVAAEAVPILVATGIFDADVSDQAPTNLFFYEALAGETGYSVDVAEEAVVASDPLGSWVSMANKHILAEGIVVTNAAEDATYVEGSDYLIDPYNGRLLAIATGDISAGQSLKVSYTYTAIAKGEMAAIERAKLQLQRKTLELGPKRLATEISREAVVYSRSQLRWDATARTLNALIFQLRRQIDGGLFRMALSAARSIANNSGGTWDPSGDPPNYDEFVRFVGTARAKVEGAFYEPEFILMSVANADLVGNWSGFTQAGKRPGDDRDENGYSGSLKGLPVFRSTEFPGNASLIGNRELVMYRVFIPIQLFGPFPSYSSNKIVAAEQYYVEEFQGADAPVPQKGAYVLIGS